MLRKHSRAASLSLGLFVLVIGCSDAPVATTFGGNAALAVSPKVLNVDALGETTKMNVVVNGGRSAATPTVSWISLDPAVATVNSAGEVTSRSNGETRIIARSAQAEDTALVRVNQRVAIIAVDGPAMVRLTALGDTATLQAVARDRLGNPVPGATTTWHSLNPEIVQVSPSGLLSAKDNGNGKAVGKSGEATDTVDVDVEQAATSLAVVPQSVTFSSLGETATFTLDGFDKRGRPIRANGVQWSIANTSVATVDNNGVVTSVGNGTTEMLAKSGSITASATITVNQLIDRVAIEPSGVSLFVGDERNVVAAAYDAGGSVIPGTTASWTSTVTSIATVTNGRIKGVGTGASTVIATIQGRSGTAAINVNAAQVGDLSLSLNSATLLRGQTLQLTAAVHDGSGNVMTGSPVSWSSSNPSVASVSAGLVTGVAAGSATITAMSDGKTSTAAITVIVPVARIATTPSSVSPAVGETRQLTAVTYDAEDQVLTGRTVTWTSSKPAVATVSSSGLVTAVSVGAATILAMSEGRSASTSVNVTEPELAPTTGTASSVKITDVGNPLDALNAKAQFKATVYDANSAPLSGVAIAWTSLNPAIATIDGNGEVTAKAVGTALIIASATCCGHSDTLGVTVWQRATTASVSPSVGSLKKGETLGLTAKMYDRLGSIIPNAPLTWKSSNTAVATVSSTGVVTALNDGSTTITAQSVDATAGAAITVSSTTAPSPSTPSALFADDFSSGDLSKTMNGSSWTSANATQVSTLIARSGSHSLRFRYAGNTDPCADGMSEQRFELGAPQKEVWIEWYLYLPNGNEGFDSAPFEVRTPEGCSSNTTNLKLIRVWGEKYSNPIDVKAGLSTWTSSLRPEWGATGYSIGARTGVQSYPDFWQQHRGSWVRMRIHLKVADSQEASNGWLRVWVDDTLVNDQRDLPLAGGVSSDGVQQPNYFRHGYFMGWANAGFTQQTYVFIDDVAMFGSNPGW